MPFYHNIHCKYTGIRGFIKAYERGLRDQYMITDKARRKLSILIFWEKYGLQAAMDAFPVKRRTLFAWKKQFGIGGKIAEALNEKSRAPRKKRIRTWPQEIIAEIKRLRWNHPNLGKDKVHPLLQTFCLQNHLSCPKNSTIGRIIKDCGGLRMFPQKVTHFGKVKPLKRRKILRKPKNLQALYPGHVVALDTIERFVHGLRRYVITFEDIYTRFGFAWSTTSHASQAAKEFFDYCRLVFPYSFTFVLTDNGSEFAKHFTEELKRLHLTHYHTYPKTPKMNAHCERFNRTIQEEFVDYHANDLTTPRLFNNKLLDWLVWYNTERVHFAFQNKLSPVQFILSLNSEEVPQECKGGWTHTGA